MERDSIAFRPCHPFEKPWTGVACGMKATTLMIGLAWTMVGICIGLGLMGQGIMDPWMAVALAVVFLYVLGLAIAFTRSRWHGVSFLLREQGDHHFQNHDRLHVRGH